MFVVAWVAGCCSKENSISTLGNKAFSMLVLVIRSFLVTVSHLFTIFGLTVLGIIADFS